MKNYFGLGLLALGMTIPFFASAAPSGWVLGSSVPQSSWIANVPGKCDTVVTQLGCDYTGPSKALRRGYEYEFADEFWAGSQDRRLRNYCVAFSEPTENGDYNKGANPTFSRTQDLINNGNRVYKNTSMVVLKADSFYYIDDVPAKRSSNNLFIKYVIEYANDESTTSSRYQHTECYPYEISRCGDGVVDKDWYMKSASDPAEECDYNDTSKTGWKDGSGKTCNRSCKLVDITPVCNSTYNGKTQYTSTSDQWLKSTDNLCTEGSVVGFTYSGTPRTYTWKCNNGTSNVPCSATQTRCGDGILQSDKEACDDGSDNGKTTSSCSATCTTVSSLVCGTNDKGTKYFSTKQTTPWLTKTSDGMCGMGLTVGAPSIVGTDSHLEWTCSNANGGSITCKAYQEYCGDGVKNGSEACDDGSNNGKSTSSCSATCTTVGSVSCGTNDKGTKYFAEKQTTPWLTKTSAGMCPAGLIVGAPSMVGTDSHLEWTCSNANGSSTTCKAYQEYCGDGVKNGSEACDDGSNNGKSTSSCSATCTTVGSVSCGTNDKGTKYFAEKQTTPWLTKTSAGMCPAGLTVGAPSIVGTDSHLEWTCSNANGSSTTCKAYQQYCGDGVKNGTEECDGTDGCDSLCNKITQSNECNQTFTGRLRLGVNKPFTDTFDAGWHDRYLFDYDVLFQENYGDHNNGSNPTFSWTSQLINNGKKVAANDSMVVLESTNYHIVSAPTRRAQNNIYIEYTIWYDNVSHSTTPSRSNLYSHKECASYEITRCGDGILDTDYNEECDPGSEGTKVMPDGRICNSECKLVTVPNPVCNSEYNGKRLNDLQNGSYLCKEGSVSNFDYNTTTHTWTWRCNNVAGKYVDCSAIKPYCGDGILDEGEQCDPNDEKHTNWGNDGCSLTCEPKYLAGQPDIEKTLQDKVPVEKVDQVLKWTVKVTAKGGDVTDFQIQDKLPEALDYVSYKVVSNNDNLTVTGPTGPVKSGSNNIYTWNVKGTLKENHVLTLEVETKVNKMPKSEDDYLNIACVIDDGKIDCDDDEPPVVSGKLNIVKTIVGSKEIKNTGDIITWNIKVTAVDGNVTNFTITDKMPPILGYSESLVLHNPGLTVGTPIVSGNEVSWRVIGTLEKGEYIEIQLTTYAKVMPDKDYDNVACVKYVDENGKETEKCDDEPLPAPDLRIKKYFLNTDGTVTKEIKTVKVDEEITYKIIFGNSGTASATITSIKDFLPKNVGYISSEIFINGKKIHTGDTQQGDMDLLKGFKVVDGVYIDIYGGITLEPNAEGYIILKGKVKNEYQDNRTNFVCIYLNDKNIDCDDVAHKLTDEVMCKKVEIQTPSFLKGGGTTNVTCNTDGGKAKLIELDCGNGKIYTGSNVASISTGCTYPSNSSTSSKTYPVQCKVDGKTTSDCKGTVTVQGDGGSGGSDPVCGKPNTNPSNDGTNVTINNGNNVEVTCKSTNGKAYIAVDCDYDYKINEDNFEYKSSGLTDSVTYTCKAPAEGSNIQCLVKKSNGSWETKPDGCGIRVKYKGGRSGGGGSDPDPDKIYDPINCFNVNAGNASIEQGEILPFYWNIEKLSKQAEEGGYVEYDLAKYPYGKDNYTSMKGESCTTEGSIALNSLLCTFEIKNGADQKVKTVVYPCLAPKAKTVDKALVNGWLTWSRNNYTIGSNGEKKIRTDKTYEDSKYAFRTNVNYIEDFGIGQTVFGEYKISLAEVKYLQCKNNQWAEGDLTQITCESNFILTNSYTVQKTPSGNLKSSTTELSKYLFINGEGVVKKVSGLLESISASEYAPNKAVKDAMDNFKNKYSKLAITVESKDGRTIKKVPGKNIYFIDGDIELGGNDSMVKLDKPITFVQTNGDTVIHGSVTNLNMMLLTDGSITFDGSDSCRNRQVVKGIFYSSLDNSGIRRMHVPKNVKSRIGESTRCTEGGLTIKGVIIGNGLKQMMDDSRSNLNYWFDESKGGKNAKTVMNGASVLIEYSPSVFTKSTMPPGAEDFTTALSIYKQ